MVQMTLFRFLIALLLAAWMPICCCSLHSLITACEACEGHGGGEAEHRHGGVSDHRHASGRHHNQDTTPAQPEKPGHDDGPCTCDKQKQTTFGVVKTTVELPTPVLAYVLPAWDPNTLLRWRTMTSCCENRAPHRPTTSLLRQHCALIV